MAHAQQHPRPQKASAESKRLTRSSRPRAPPPSPPQHMNEKMSTNHKRELSGSFTLAAGDAYAAAKELPYCR